MREIKFRAWDKEKKIWIWPYPEGFNIIGEITVFDILKQYHISEYNNLKIVQYTGLKDKNGKEIYDGDIVVVTDTNYPEHRTIEWGFHSDHSSYMYQMGWNIWEEEVLEIVGNIYENPELSK